MLDTAILETIALYTTPITAISFYAYLYYVLNQINRNRTSIREDIEGVRLFDSEQIQQIVSSFKEDNFRIEAIKTFTQYDTSKTRELVERINGKIDIYKLRILSLRKQLLFAAICCLLFSILSALVIYSYNNSPKDRNQPKVVDQSSSHPSASTQENIPGRISNEHSTASVIPRGTIEGNEPPSLHPPVPSVNNPKAIKPSSTSTLLVEMKNYNLYKYLEEAESIQAAQTDNYTIEALDRYNRVLHALSRGARAQLDGALLEKARSDENSKHLSDAASKYQLMFNKILEQYRQQQEERN